MKLFYAPGTCSLAVHVALLEAGQTFSAERVDLKTKQTESGQDYNTLNPKGSVPALQLDSGEVLTEGAALLQYVADLAPQARLAPAPGTMLRFRLQEWLNYVATEVHKSFSVLFGADRNVASQEGNAQLKAAYKEVLAKRFGFLAEHLKNNTYLMGEQFTVADAYLYTVLRWTKLFGIDLTRWPVLVEYTNHLRSRPHIAAAQKAESPKA